METYFVYILYSLSHDHYYIGQTNDVQQRLNRHNSKQVLSTKSYVPWRIELFLEKPSRSESMALEKKLKNLNRERLKAFIEKYRINPVTDANE